MKVSINLSEEELAFVDGLVDAGLCRSRSAAIARAIRLLRAADLGLAYDAAHRDWARSEDGLLWDATPNRQA